MWTAEAIEPSNVRHIDQIQNYPEALDQVARLRLLSQLAILGDSRAAGALKSFLKNKKWGLSGMAVVMLLQEGDDASMDCIKQLLFDPDPELRLQSALVLTLYGKDEEAAEVLKNIYFDQDVDTKLYILEALGYVSGPAFFDFFVKAMNEPFAKLRIASASALIQAVNR